MKRLVLLLLLLLTLLPAKAETTTYRMVWFRADWCPWSAKMKPSVDKFFAHHKNVDRIQVDVDKTDAPEYKLYSKYNPKSATPYIVLLDAKGNVIRTWDKFVTLEDLENGLP